MNIAIRPGPNDPADAGPPQHIVVVEDDREIAQLISNFLAQRGLIVTRASNERQLRRVLRSQGIDLILLDIMLPDVDGLTICQSLRAAPETAAIPIIIVSALSSQVERVRGLDIGADDYLVKPFGPEELLARIRAVLRRHSLLQAHHVASLDILEAEGMRLDLRRHALHAENGARLPLTTMELALLTIFMQQPQTVLSRDMIARRLHGRNLDPLDRTIDVAVSRLRRKIEPDPLEPTVIETVRNGGYVFTRPVRSVTEA
ncbi:response regulator transcription factor [Sediminicoccus sp. KRV36]|uniref:response regulator transcription factor n=1 Tax=Sediminicoccus sp. KRV36 TaxID=3133721 RepID=UPI00200C742C|nr:response regulator transcription factor [Sediminicoccus rosea]UPY37294.1 response regulator transcription factor [Sediminicoccus rosea]